MLIDTHCHLTDEKFVDVDAVLSAAKIAGVEKIIMPGTSLSDSKNVVAQAEKLNQFCLVGIHPEEVGVDLGEVDELEKLIKSSRRVVGVGEIGLDFYRDKEKVSKAKQIELFRSQVELALRNNLPVAIHMREAEEEMVEELDKLIGKDISGQFHCFAGSDAFLSKIIKMGFYVSFCGNVTYKSAGNLRELLKKVPLERLLLETDSPYLAPEPVRGTVNEPANVKIIAEFEAIELGMDISELAQITSQNAKCLYSLEN